MNESTLRVVVADDEPLARELLCEMLSELGGVHIVEQCDNGLAAVRACQVHSPDLIFLDVQMPKLDGFEVLEVLDQPVPVVFVTAYDEYAVRAFEKEAVDYLLKPFSKERLEKALQKWRRFGGRSSGTPGLAAEARPPGTYVERIAVKEGSDIGVIPVQELEWVRSEDDYIRLASRGREWLKHQSLQSLEESLNPSWFVRIHRTCLVNASLVTKVEPETRDRFWVFLKDGTMLPASRPGEKRLREVLGI